MKKYHPLSIICSALLFFGVFNLPIDYYTFLRVVISIASLYICYELYDKKQDYWWVFIGIAILFNPIWIVTFDKSTWQVIDIVVAIVFLALQPKNIEYQVPKSRLDNLGFQQSLEEENNIINEYGKLIEEVNKPDAYLRYPAMVYPISLLPASKEDIRNSLESAIAGIGKSDAEKDMKNALEVTLFMLDQFIADEDAKVKNEKILNNPEYQKVIKKKQSKSKK